MRCCLRIALLACVGLLQPSCDKGPGVPEVLSQSGFVLPDCRIWAEMKFDSKGREITHAQVEWKRISAGVSGPTAEEGIDEVWGQWLLAGGVFPIYSSKPLPVEGSQELSLRFEWAAPSGWAEPLSSGDAIEFRFRFTFTADSGSPLYVWSPDSIITFECPPAPIAAALPEVISSIGNVHENCSIRASAYIDSKGHEITHAQVEWKRITPLGSGPLGEDAIDEVWGQWLTQTMSDGTEASFSVSKPIPVKGQGHMWFLFDWDVPEGWADPLDYGDTLKFRFRFTYTTAEGNPKWVWTPYRYLLFECPDPDVTGPSSVGDPDPPGGESGDPPVGGSSENCVACLGGVYPSAGPELEFPADGEEVTTQPSLGWRELPGIPVWAGAYQIEIRRFDESTCETDWSGVGTGLANAPDCFVADSPVNAYTVAMPLDSPQTYRWRVRGTCCADLNGDGNLTTISGPWSSEREFRVQ